MSFEEFQDGHHSSHLGYQNGMILAILNLCRSHASHQVSAQSDTVWEEMSFEEFQEGHHSGHLGYWKGTVLAILNLYVTVITPIKFPLNPTYHLRDVV